MKTGSCTSALFVVFAAIVACTGCSHAPGFPQPGDEVSRPDKEFNFQVLYKQNCSGCHGDNGRDGAAIPLNNPAYLAIAGGDNIRTATAHGVSATLMPGFATSSGGMLTDQQIDALVHGMLHEWSRASEFAGVNLPPYSSSSPGNALDGKKAYEEACARCHGVDGTGLDNATEQGGGSRHSIVDRSYLTLVSDQSLRSIVVAGHPDKSTPDWRTYITGPGARSLTAQEINDIVAWIAGHREPTSRQSISNPSGNEIGAATKEGK